MGEADRMDVDDQVTGDRMKSAAAALILFRSAGIVAELAPSFRDLGENVAFMWISGEQEPDFRTLCNFRLRLNEAIRKGYSK